MKKSIVVLCLAVMVFACSGNISPSDLGTSQAEAIKVRNESLSFKQAFDGKFMIGAAINTRQAKDQDVKAMPLISKHFNSLTPENDMKWTRIQAQEGVFDFSGADAIVQKAKAENASLFGHTLIWHSQVPDWVFKDKSGQRVSREVLIERMRTHIFTLAGRYKDDIYGWDVLNEALNEDGTLRNSDWLQIIGEQYIELAFSFAHEAAPNAKLYYNDYNLFKPKKRAGAVALAKKLIDKGIPIHGIGAQGHYGLDVPVEELEQSIIAFAELGLDVVISELDITVLPFPEPEKMGADVNLRYDLQSFYNPFENGISQEASEQLRQGYLSLFALFLKHHDKIGRVTFWGVSDAHSWRNNWPMTGRTDFPLVFDRQYKAKPFVSEILDMAIESKQEY